MNNTPALLTTIKEIKCKIIIADNTLNLHTSDAHYFYIPSFIQDYFIESVEYYKMISEVPDQLEFAFTEHCFCFFIKINSIGHMKKQECNFKFY